MPMEPRVVAITGASSGIGRAVAEHFAAKGWCTGLIARSRVNLEATQKAITDAGGLACVAVADVTDSVQLGHAAEHIEQRLGPIDVWVNSAGISVVGRFVDIPEQVFNRVTQVNYLGSVNGIRVALDRMTKRNNGTIVQVLSAASQRGAPLQASYSGSKYALRGFIEAINGELVQERSAVRISMVHPPSINTPIFNHLALYLPKPMSPIPPIYQPEVAADAIYMAAMTRRRDVWVAAPSLALSVANRIAPGLLDVVFGRIGWGMTQADVGAAASARDLNLDAPGQQPGASHGPFDHVSRSSSVQLWLARHRRTLIVAAGVGVCGLAVLRSKARSPGPTATLGH